MVLAHLVRVEFLNLDIHQDSRLQILIDSMPLTGVGQLWSNSTLCTPASLITYLAQVGQRYSGSHANFQSLARGNIRGCG